MKGICDKCNEREAAYTVRNMYVMVMSIGLDQDDTPPQEISEEPFQICLECATKDKLLNIEDDYTEIKNV